jgi:hypothetical protein
MPGLVWFEVETTPPRPRDGDKKWRRDLKIRLIEQDNRDRRDLYPGISNAFTPGSSRPSSHSRKAPPAVET